MLHALGFVLSALRPFRLGLQDKLYLGNLEAKRDWGFAGDYVEAMWLMLQQDRPDDYVIATGETHAVKEFAAKVFEKLDLDYKRYVAVDPRYFRPTEAVKSTPNTEHCFLITQHPTLKTQHCF